jgi:hypothetical protein
LKRFRYAVENLLPERSVVWDESLGQTQGLLGEIHDLDVLRSRIAEESEGLDPASTRSLRHAIATKRRACIEEYRRRTSGDESLLREWRAGLPHGQAIESATAARLRATARAMDPHLGRTAEISRLARQLFDGLAASGTIRRFRDQRLRTILDAAAQLHAIDIGGRQTPRHKAARDFLRAVLVPLGWNAPDWTVLSEIVRYHRGAEPAARHKRFVHLTPERQECVRGLAGVLRLARGLCRCGVTVGGGVCVDETTAYVRLRVSGLQDTEDHAARLEVAKHLLEGYLRRPILIESAKAVASTRATAPGLQFTSAPNQHGCGFEHAARQIGETSAHVDKREHATLPGTLRARKEHAWNGSRPRRLPFAIQKAQLLAGSVLGRALPQIRHGAGRLKRPMPRD